MTGGGKVENNGGDLINNTRAFAVNLSPFIKNNIYFRERFNYLIGLFAYSLQYHLKSQGLKNEDFNYKLYDKSFYSDLKKSNHEPLFIYPKIVQLLFDVKINGLIGNLEIYHFKSELNKFIEVCGACERIKNIPIPFSYSTFLKMFIFFYVMLFPWVYCIQLSFFVIPITCFILYILAGIEIIAEEIEDPFNGDPNDLPTLSLAKNIKKILIKFLWILNKIMTPKSLTFLLIPLLLACLLPMPYGYYILVRVMATVAFAYISYQERTNQIMWIFVGLVLLFQPIEKVALGRTLWNIVDVAVAVFLVWYRKSRR